MLFAVLTLSGDTSEMRPTVIIPHAEKRVTKAGQFKCDICNINFQVNKPYVTLSS